MALRWRRSAAQSRAICLLRRTSLRSHFVVARVAARARAAMARLRSIAACRSSSKDEIGGLDLSFTVMVGSSTAPGASMLLRGAGAHGARSSGARTSSPERTSRLEGTLRSSGSFSGDFLQMLENHAKWGVPSPAIACAYAERGSHRVRGTFRINDNKLVAQAEGGANINACASLAASSMVMNAAPAAAKSFSSPSSASMR